MVQRVIGKANDFEIVLTRSKGDRWETAIPANLSGEYAIELFAEDAAGNKSYIASAIFIIDAATLCAHIILDNYREELVDTEFTVEIMQQDFIVEVITPACGKKGAL